jgi:hypothetical protein
LAPQQHLRSTVGRTSRPGLPTVIWVLVLGATLALSACGAKEAGAAAIVNGTVISDQDVQTVTSQLNTLSDVEQKLSSSDALLSLILAPYVLAEAERAGKTVSASQARKVIDKVADPSPTTVEFVRMQLAVPQLDDAGRAAVVKEIGKARITINPRYGTFDAKRVALNPISPNWIKATAPTPATAPAQ